MKRKTSNEVAQASRYGHVRLDVFRIARQLAIDLYAETARFPAEERFGLVSQIRRSAVSIPANIAEGAARRSKKEFSRFLLTARGSTTELRLLLDVAHQAGILSEQGFMRYDAAIERIFAMTNGLIRHSDRSA